MVLLTILLMSAAILLTRVSNLRLGIHIIVAQSVIVALACAVAGIHTGEVHMYVAALLTAVIKVGLISYALYRLLPYLAEERELVKPNFTTFTAILSIILAHGLLGNALPEFAANSTLPAAVSLSFIGLLLIMTRRQALMQTLGLLTMENGLYLLGLSITQGLPLIIELGIFFDILVAVVILVILTYRLKLSFETTDTGLLKKLKG